MIISIELNAFVMLQRFLSWTPTWKMDHQSKAKSTLPAKQSLDLRMMRDISLLLPVINSTP